MTGPDLIRLAEDLAKCGGIHRLTNCIAAACHVFAEHERRARACVEAWEDGPHGVGMSDKSADCAAASRAPSGDGDAAGPGGQPSNRCASTGPETTLDLICHNATLNPAPITPERGERLPVPSGGISHGEGSPILRDFGHAQSDFGRRYERCVPRRKPINPEDLGDGA